ncbi:MAG: T9SS type A sorting domain-containing protein [Bacteroidia bacterium]
MAHLQKIVFLFLTVCSMRLAAQTAPSHLKHFGFAVVDCLWDDPHDASSITNYISEVDTFSNIAQLCVYDYTDNVTTRVNLMTGVCVKPMLAVQAVFFQYVDTSGPSGANYDLFSDYALRWASFKTTNQAVLNANSIGCFYIIDEPYWNGVTYSDLVAVSQLIKNDFPNIPIMFIEAYPVVSIMQIPTTVDWVGFDMYGIFDPGNDATFMGHLNTVKNARSTASQEVFLIIDDQWLDFYGQAGYPPDTIEYMVQNYYDLAVSDTSISGLIGYLWPGGLDGPSHLGVRDLPANVIAKNVQIGKMIKANNHPCGPVAIIENTKAEIQIMPNPASSFLTINNAAGTSVFIYDVFGRLVLTTVLVTDSEQLAVGAFSNGVYVLEVKTEQGDLKTTKRIVIAH